MRWGLRWPRRLPLLIRRQGPMSRWRAPSGTAFFFFFFFTSTPTIAQSQQQPRPQLPPSIIYRGSPLISEPTVVRRNRPLPPSLKGELPPCLGGENDTVPITCDTPAARQLWVGGGSPRKWPTQGHLSHFASEAAVITKSK